ncbi:MAG: nicotinate (nicotinamide) nucleotide adenylyltransferase [Candidatus Izemoplasma sp.]
MKVVYGGAFNPVTKAHIRAYKYIVEKIEVEEFIFLPVSNAYTKSELLSNHHRVSMLELATKDFNDIKISKLEIEDNDFLGTYQSLIRLSDSENCEISFVIGADNLFYLHKWLNIKSLLSEFKIIILKRNGINITKTIEEDIVLKEFKKSFIIFDEFDEKTSSSLFRETFDKKIVNDEVYNYIIKNDLFRGGKDV